MLTSYGGTIVMSDSTTTNSPEIHTAPAAIAVDSVKQATQLFAQDDVDRIVKERVSRERAKFADHDELQQKAKRFDEMQAANMSELEKANKAKADAEAAAAEARTEALRYRIAARYGITDDDAALFLTGSDAESMERQATRLLERTPNTPRPDPSQGAKSGGDMALNGDPLLASLKSKLGMT